MHCVLSLFSSQFLYLIFANGWLKLISILCSRNQRWRIPNVFLSVPLLMPQMYFPLLIGRWDREPTSPALDWGARLWWGMSEYWYLWVLYLGNWEQIFVTDLVVTYVLRWLHRSPSHQNKVCLVLIEKIKDWPQSCFEYIDFWSMENSDIIAPTWYL